MSERGKVKEKEIRQSTIAEICQEICEWHAETKKVILIIVNCKDLCTFSLLSFDFDPLLHFVFSYCIFMPMRPDFGDTKFLLLIVLFVLFFFPNVPEENSIFCETSYRYRNRA